MSNADKPAFPDPLRGGDQNFTNQHPEEWPTGITKREYFAAMAMQGILSSCDGNIQGMEPNEPNMKYFAELSVKAADELLKQLEKQRV